MYINKNGENESNPSSTPLHSIQAPLNVCAPAILTREHTLSLYRGFFTQLTSTSLSLTSHSLVEWMDNLCALLA